MRFIIDLSYLQYLIQNVKDRRVKPALRIKTGVCTIFTVERKPCLIWWHRKNMGLIKRRKRKLEFWPVYHLFVKFGRISMKRKLLGNLWLASTSPRNPISPRLYTCCCHQVYLLPIFESRNWIIARIVLLNYGRNHLEMPRQRSKGFLTEIKLEWRCTQSCSFGQ